MLEDKLYAEIMRHLYKLENRINKLENEYIHRINCLCEALDTLSEENEKLKKIPHKCPVCDGLGGTKISGTIDEECQSCKGTGIIWG